MKIFMRNLGTSCFFFSFQKSWASCIYLLAIIFCLLFFVFVLLLQTKLLLQMFKNTYLCSLTTRLTIKTQLKEIYKNNTSLTFKSNNSMNSSTSELIHYEPLTFFPKVFKEYDFKIFAVCKTSWTIFVVVIARS